MAASKDQEDQFFICFADIVHVLRRSKRKICYWAIAGGLIGLSLAFLKPIRYEAEGTFREKGMMTNGVNHSSVLQLLSGVSLGGAESEAASLMTSRKILKEVIDKLHLQGDLSAIADTETASKLVWRNLKLAMASSNAPFPVLSDICCPLKISSLKYEEEIPRALYIKILPEGQYEVRDGGGIFSGAVGKGKLGEPFISENLSFTLVSARPDQSLALKSYALSVKPLETTVKDLCQVLKVDASKFDKSLLKIKCEHRDRHLASAIVNATMESYRNYLKNYYAEIALHQLDYLNQRRDQLTLNLGELMRRHAEFLAEDASSSGSIDTSKEMDFLAKSQHEYKQKLLDNELEIKRLANAKPANLAYYHRYSANEGDPAAINNVLSEMRSLKQQRDALEIELQKKTTSQGVANLQLSFEQQIDELREVQQNLLEVRDVSEQFRQGRLPENIKILNDTRFLLKGWLERLHKAQSDGPTPFQDVKENFHFYLNNLERSLAVHERILQERLTHQQNPSGEYQGISLELATNLYLDYSKQLVEMEAEERQNAFFIGQLEDPEFEITSLSSGLEDDVSKEMIRKASELVLNLRDQKNQSLREQERIKEDLALQRTFLTLHLKQMVQLIELNKKLIDEKIFALENISLELIHQKISLLERNLQDYLKSRLYNLQQEKALIQRHLEEIHLEMATLPKKWVSEQLVTHEVETNQKILEELVKLVESKNVSHHIDVIQSAPVDAAIAPLNPRPPHLFLWGFLGICLGGGLGSGFVLFDRLKKGLPATSDHLSLMGIHVSGKIAEPTAVKNGKQEVLRRLLTHFTPVDTAGQNCARTLLLLEAKGPDYGRELATLILKSGDSVLLLDLNFDDPHRVHFAGLLQFLHGSIEHLPIRTGKEGDWLDAGGTTPFVVETIRSAAFTKLIDQLKTQYDWILVTSHAPLASAEAESLLALFPDAVLTITQETIDELAFYRRCGEGHRFSFVFYEEEERSSSLYAHYCLYAKQLWNKFIVAKFLARRRDLG